MREALISLRYLLAIKCIGWALDLLPRDSMESRELAVFVTQSWISKPGGQYVSTNRPTPEQLRADLQALWKEKLRG